VRSWQRASAPWLGAFLLRRFADPDIRDWLIEDLGRRHGEMLGERGRWRAGLWFWKQVAYGCIGGGESLSGIAASVVPTSGRTATSHHRRFPIFGMDSMTQDVRFALRTLMLKPGFTLVAVAMLAIGSGANTALFSVALGVLSSPLPFEEPDRLVRIYERRPEQGRPRNTVSMPDFADWRRRTSSFEHMALYTGEGFNLFVDDTAHSIAGAPVTWEFFRTLGLQPALGRDFVVADDGAGAAPVVILSDAIWRDQFASNEAVLGTSILLDDTPHTIVGILPPGVAYPFNARLWVPLALDPAQQDRSSHDYSALGRLAADVPLQQGRDELDATAHVLESEYPTENSGHYTNVFSLHGELVASSRSGLNMLMGIAAVVLLIVCANVANMQLARATGRSQEIAVRAALGAQRGRIVRQLLTENLILGLVASGLGLLLANVGVALLVGYAFRDLPWIEPAAGEPAVLAFTFGLAIFTTCLFGVAPALRGSRMVSPAALRAAGGRSVESSWLRGTLVAAEVALALLLLVGAGLLARSLTRLYDADLGFDPANVVSAGLQLPEARYPAGASRLRFLEELRDSVDALPGIDATGLAYTIPLDGSNSGRTFTIEGRPAPEVSERIYGRVRVVDAGYFETMRIGLMRGRLFAASGSVEAEPVLMINEQLARLYWPDEDPIGARVNFGGEAMWRIIGIVNGVRHSEVADVPEPELYFSVAQTTPQSMALLVRSERDVGELAPLLRARLAALDPSLPFISVMTMRERVDSAVGPNRVLAQLTTMFAAVATLLAALGIYGVISYSVSQRTREISLRMALGSRPRDVVRLVVREGMRFVVPGLVLGIIGASVAGRLIAGLLYEAAAIDVPTLAVAVLLLLAVAGLAGFIPARRAARLDPLDGLRSS